MTPRWNPTLDASNLRAEAADDALGEIYAGRDEWVDDDRPPRAEILRDEWGDDDDD
jgi:hypothetical protein